ncbi:galactofuranose ABC transporter, permease protein YjfF [Streptomyces sp. NBC_00887]|uniref:galactofuranose ABC transporter, permease protein YjfF n=1 Tax=Streptomyces sp. NBC_00887 TaxID=2975859 RepID=UPI0038659C3D|nr:sugar ABC transporter permease YjfF [Streptomyces sp. NBC_00887]WSY35408.1 sugar ABC transporter permease YjfF [Streptomyces sp. NBC_00887]
MSTGIAGAAATLTRPFRATASARSRARIPLMVTAVLLVAMFAVGSVRYDGFFSAQVLLNLLIDNGFLLVVAVGVTFVILTGGIDLSVGSVVALSTMLTAWLVEQHQWPLVSVIPLVLLVGGAGGSLMGWIIHTFEIQPFIVTLAGMFLARGLCYTISTESISISDPTTVQIAQTRLYAPGGLFVSISVVIALAVVVAAFVTLHHSRFGRNVHALGGNENSARLMGLPVGTTKVAVYAISGLCSALGGVLLTFYMLSGYALHAMGLELDAIAATVIGGTLLTGGSGFVLGTAMGVLVLGMIQTVINFQGTLSSWWTRIVIGALLLVFIVLQRLMSGRRPAAD